MAYTTFQELEIYQSVQDLSVWLVPHVGKWPKSIRPTIGHHTRVAASTGSWMAHLQHADTYRLRAALAAEYEPYLGRL